MHLEMLVFKPFPGLKNITQNYLMRTMLFASRLLVPVLVFLFTELRCIIGDSGCDGHIAIIDLTFTQNNGTIYSPGYPDNYRNNEICRWRIQAPPGQKVAVSIKELDIEESSRCRYDSLSLYDGPSYFAPLLTKICGNTDLPGMYFSSGRYLYMRFNSDWSDSGKGFVAHYRTVNTASDPGCDFTQIIDTTFNRNGTIYSPGYPNNYRDNQACSWIIKAPPEQSVVIYFTEFDIQGTFPCGGDNVEIFAGFELDYGLRLRRICGNSLPRPVYSHSSGQYRYMSFHSDGSDSGRGFVAHYRAVNTLYELRAGSRDDFTIDLSIPRDGRIYSPGYLGGFYYHLENCSWLIQAPPGQKVLLYFTNLDIADSNQCHYDSISIYDGLNIFAPRLSKSCGSSLPLPFLSSGSDMYIRFTSGLFGDGKGFEAACQAVTKTSGSACNGVTAAFIDLNFTQNGTIYSPGYPTDHANNQDCSWLIQAPPGQKVLIYFTEFDLGKTNHYCRHSVGIFDGPGKYTPLLTRLCVNRPAPVYSSGRYMYMKFDSDYWSDTAKRFVAHYRTLNSSSGCPKIVPGASAGVIYSPNFPWNYPKGKSCEWHIKVPRQRSMVLKFINFDLKPSPWSGYCDDYVLVRDQNNHEIGKYCGSQIPSSITFNGKATITVRFYSKNSEGKYSGFMAFYDLTGHSNGSNVIPTHFPNSSIYICKQDSQTNLFVESLSSVSIGSNPDIDETPCTFTIKTTKGHILELRFKTMSIYGNSTCSMGYVKVRDGSSPTSQLLGTYCSAANYQDGVTTKGNSMFIEYNAYFGRDAFTATISSKKGSNNSKTVIAVICSLTGVVVIGLLVLYFYCKKRKSSQENQQLGSTVPAASETSRVELSSDSPPAYSSVMANEPPPYSSVEAAAPPPGSTAATRSSRPTQAIHTWL